MSSESEQDRRETSADIADEIRRAVESMGDELPYTVSAGTMRRVADRIKAALRREKSEIEADALVVGGIVEAARQNPVGNAAAIYAALVKIHDLTNALDEKCGVDPVEIRDIARAALSAPERNCDVYKTPEDCMRAFESYVIEHGKLGFINPFTEVVTEVVKWLLAPAEEKGATA